MMNGCSNQCGICVNKLTEPVSLVCGDRFCRSCYAYWENTGAVVCPDCHARVRKTNAERDLQLKTSWEQQTSTRSSRINKFVLPPLPLPAPHKDMMLLYRAFDDPETSTPPCNLGCYVRGCNPARRFYFCDTCETAFHTLNYQASHEPFQGSNLTAPLTQMIQNPTSKPSLILEAQQKHQGNVQMHEKLLGHALYCASESCGYRTCKLMQSYLWPEQGSRKRRAFSISSPEDTSAMDTSAAKTLYSPLGSSHSTRNKPNLPSPAACVSPEEASLQSRAEQIDRAVGLSGGCRLCIRAANLLYKHEQTCTSAECFVPYCSELKKLNAKKLSLSTDW